MMETGRLWEEYPVIYEMARRVAAARGNGGAGVFTRTLAAGGLEVTGAGDGPYEVRHKDRVVFRCRGGESPDVYKPGEWIVWLMSAGRSIRPREEGTGEERQFPAGS